MSLPLLHASGWRIGQVFLVEDVTQARLAQQQQAQILWAQATLGEREQLADELHDGLSQSLAFLNLQSQAAQVYLMAGQREAALASLTRLSEGVSEIQDENRELIGSLLSVSRPAQNFCDTLRQFLVAFEEQTGLPVNLEIDGDSEMDLDGICDSNRLPPQTAVELIRIIQEALANVRKHARGASQVNIQVSARDEQLSLAIRDDGAGFKPAAQGSDGKHFGLQIMQQRAARIGGQIEIDSAPGMGVHIELRVPFADQS
jgi:signal transduction histidine kinase